MQIRFPRTGALVGAVLISCLLALPQSADTPSAGHVPAELADKSGLPPAAASTDTVASTQTAEATPTDAPTSGAPASGTPASESGAAVAKPAEPAAAPDKPTDSLPAPTAETSPPAPAAAAPALPRLPDLPSREVKAPRVNTVKAIPEPPPSQSEILDREWAARNGGNAQANATASGQPNAALPGQSVPRGTLTMRGNAPLDLNSSFPSGGTAPSRNSLAPGIDRLAGQAEAVGPTSIRVNGTTLRFHGVLATARAERCGPNKSEPRRCIDAAREWLRTRFKDAPMVSCRFPRGSQEVVGGEVPAVCRDSSGVDLGGMLVLEGLAQADQSVSNEYARAEGTARQAKKGLWLFR